MQNGKYGAVDFLFEIKCQQVAQNAIGFGLHKHGFSIFIVGSIFLS